MIYILESVNPQSKNYEYQAFSTVHNRASNKYTSLVEGVKQLKNKLDGCTVCKLSDLQPSTVAFTIPNGSL